MTQKIMVTINFGGSLDYFEAKDFECNNAGVIVIRKLDDTKVIVSPMNVLIEITHE